MTRTQPTTTWTDRIRPTSVWTKPRAASTFTCDTTSFTCDTTSFTCDKTLFEAISTLWGTPRKGTLLQDLTLAQVTDLLGDKIEGIAGINGNIIVTQWN